MYVIFILKILEVILFYQTKRKEGHRSEMTRSGSHPAAGTELVSGLSYV